MWTQYLLITGSWFRKEGSVLKKSVEVNDRTMGSQTFCAFALSEVFFNTWGVLGTDSLLTEGTGDCPT
jgi:hypothetical protein